MTGGGAKGLYEAGVIHAFHLTGMEFDVITGSSIGAMNSAFFAEYLYQKRGLPGEVLADPLQAVEALDPLVKAYHHAWLLMPDKRVIDDSPEGPLGKLKDDLLRLQPEPAAAGPPRLVVDRSPARKHSRARGVAGGAAPAGRAGRAPGRGRAGAAHLQGAAHSACCRRPSAPTWGALAWIARSSRPAKTARSGISSPSRSRRCARSTWRER